MSTLLDGVAALLLSDDVAALFDFGGGFPTCILEIDCGPSAAFAGNAFSGVAFTGGVLLHAALAFAAGADPVAGEIGAPT